MFYESMKVKRKVFHYSDKNQCDIIEIIDILQ